MLIAILIPHLWLLYHVPILQIMGFFTGVVFFLYLPGYFLTDILRWEDNPLSRTIISLLAGVAITPIAYYCAGILGQHWLFIVFTAGISSYSIYMHLNSQGRAHLLRPPTGWWKMLPVLAVLLGLLHFSHFSDLTILPTGGFKLRTTNFTESIFHQGIINVVEKVVPPFYPYASGYSLSVYHIDMHVLAAVFCRYLWIDSSIMTYYFLPLLLFGLIIAIPAVFFYSLHADLNLSLLLGLLMFSADLSFIPGILLHGQDTIPWTIIFCSTIWSLFTLNGIMVAIPLFFGGALSLQKYYSSGNVRYLVFFSLFALASYRVKSSMGFQMLAVALLALPFIEWKSRNRLWIQPLLFIAATACIIVADLHMKSPSPGSTWSVLWSPLNGIRQTAEYLNLQSWLNAIQAPLQHPFTLTSAVILSFIGLMGLRLICVKYLADYVRNRPMEPVIPFLLIFIFSGIGLSECIYLEGRYDEINNGVWFKVQSIFAATYFIPAYISSMRDRYRTWAVILLVVVLSYPTTLNFLRLRNISPTCEITRNQLEASRFIQSNLPTNAVIIEKPIYTAPSISSHFGGRASVLAPFRSFPFFCMSIEDIASRQHDLKSFFGYSTDEGRLAVLRKYQVTHLVLPSRLDRYVSQCKWARRIYYNAEISIYETILVPQR